MKPQIVYANILGRTMRCEVIPAKVFQWSNRNKVDNRWRTFFYAPGMGFETGNKVYVGRNDWNTEASAIEAQDKHEARWI